VFDTALDAQVKEQRESFQHIQQALARSEFVLYFQPKVDMRTGDVIGAEALIRWQHPERGLLPPAAFLPAIEGQALSIDVGEWVIDTALAQMSAWHAQGLDLSVSVNIGSLQLQQEGFVAYLKNALARYPDVAPQQLEIEILETSALQDITHVSSVMRACQALGVHFALDDFGTGYSSLSYLKRLPAELVKIDQSFIRDMLGDVEDLAIVKGVIGLAHAFNREVIAEGVETIEHGSALLALGCHLAQGYGIARPMPARDLPGWVASWQPDAAWLAVDAVHAARYRAPGREVKSDLVLSRNLL
jgi:EAL domain-containing protein (putative c-di-GMP-specific phosphodiesterase class I)